MNEAIDKPPIQGGAKDKGDLLVRGDNVGHLHLDIFVIFLGDNKNAKSASKFLVRNQFLLFFFE